MTTIDLASSNERGKHLAPHCKMTIDVTPISESEILPKDADCGSVDASVEREEQPRGRTMSRLPRSLDIAKGSKKISNDLTTNNGSADEDASNLKRTEQPTAAKTSQLVSQSISQTRATSSSGVKTPSTAATTPSEETKPTVLLDIRHEPEDPDSDSATRVLFLNCLILENITRAKSLGSGAYGQVYALKVIRCGHNVKQRLAELSQSQEVPKDYRVALKVLTWSDKQCECQSCETLNRLRRAQRLPRCRIFPPTHVPQCEVTDTFFNEIMSLHRLIGVPGIQQFIGYEILEDSSGKLASTCIGPHFCGPMTFPARHLELKVSPPFRCYQPAWKEALCLQL
jgi:hypothetical protein